MTMEEQPILPLDPVQLPAKAAEFAAEGRRLVQVCATTLPGSFEITYTFEAAGAPGLTSLRVLVPRDRSTVPSITESYFAAFTYENELQDLFGLKVEGLKLDFQGTFYHLARKAPFSEAKPPKEGK